MREKLAAQARGYGLLAVGLVIMAFGVAFSIRAGLGTSPISSLPWSGGSTGCRKGEKRLDKGEYRCYTPTINRGTGRVHRISSFPASCGRWKRSRV